MGGPGNGVFIQKQERFDVPRNLPCAYKEVVGRPVMRLLCFIVPLENVTESETGQKDLGIISPQGSQSNHICLSRYLNRSDLS